MSLQNFKQRYRQPVLIISLGIVLMVISVAAIRPLRNGIVSSLESGREYLLLEAESEILELEEGDTAEEAGDSGEEGNQKKKVRKRSTFGKIVTAPVRLFAGIFKRRDKDSLAIRNANGKDLEGMKIIPVQRSKSSKDMMADVDQPPVDGDATVAHRAAQALFDDAVNQYEKGRVDAAIEKLAAATALTADFAEAHNLMGVCYDQKRQYSSAQQSYEKALRADRDNARYMNNLGYSYALAGDDGQAIKWYKKGLKEDPKDLRLHNNIGMAYGRKGNMSKAREHFIIAVGQTGAHLNLGYLFNQQGEYEEAIRQYQLALNAQPNSLTALGNLAQLYERTGRLREASQVGEQYRRVVAINQKDQAGEQE